MHSPTPSDAQAAGHAVCNAEQFVRGAWELELLRQRGYLQFAVRAAYEDCDAAYRILAEAQRDGDPRKIAAAHIHLEAALGAARTSEIDSDRVRRTLRAELDLLSRTSRQHAISAPLHHLEHDRSAITAQLSASQRAPIRQVRTLLVKLRPKSPRVQWLTRLLVRRTASSG
jgi:hypothetical protein